LEFFSDSGNYISGAYQAPFTVSASAMQQYSYTGSVPSNAVSVNVLIRLTDGSGALHADFICVRAATESPVPAPAPSASQARTGAWKLVFSDDFDTFETSNWSKGPNSWTDTYGEEQWDPALVTVANSKLRLTCEKRGNTWYSGLVHSRDKRFWTYGYFEARIKLSAGQGLCLLGGSSRMPTSTAFGLVPAKSTSWSI
jgi:beta-glucanase (GH16 family)